MMDNANIKQVKRVEVKQASHNLMYNECRWKTATDKKMVRMVTVLVYYTDSQGHTDSVSMRCCCEHQEDAEESLIENYKLTR